MNDGDLGVEIDPDNIVPLRPTNGSAGQNAAPKSSGQWEGDPDSTPPYDYLIKHIVPQRGVGLLLGTSSMGKTYVLLDLIQSVILGTDFAGQQVKRPGAALLFVPEGAMLIRPRWEAIKKAKVKPYLESIGETLKPLPFKWEPELLTLNAQDAEMKLMAYCQQVQAELTERQHDCDLVLIGIDTWSAASNFKSHNDAAEAQPVMNLLQRVSAKIGAAVLCVDHFGKDPDRGARGTTAKEAAADFVLSVLGDKSNTGVLSNLRLVVQKMRGGAPGREVPFMLSPVNMGVDEDGEPVTEMTIKWDGVMPVRRSGRTKSEAIRRLCEALDEALTSHGEVTEPRPGFKVKAVPSKIVQAEFIARFPPTAADDDDARISAARKAWERVVKHPASRTVMASYSFGERSLMWRINETVAR